MMSLPTVFVRLTLRVKLCGQGLRAEADAARRLPRSTPEEANRDLQPSCRHGSCELTRRFSAGPKPGRISFYAELGRNGYSMPLGSRNVRVRIIWMEVYEHRDQQHH